jgi:hypothetical protein
VKQPENAGNDAFIERVFFEEDELCTGGIDLLRRFHQEIVKEFVHYSTRAAIPCPENIVRIVKEP